MNETVWSFHQTRRQFLQSSALLLARPVFYPQGGTRITTIAGTGIAGTAADGEPADRAQINNPYGLVIGPDRGLYWCDLGSNRILRLDLPGNRISVVAGTGTAGYSGDGGPAKAAELRAPHEVRFDNKGDLYFVERDNHTVRRVDMASKVITTVAGTGTRGYSGEGGPADQAQLNQPHSIAFDRTDNLFICDIVNNRVRRVDARTGTITTFAGTGEAAPTPDEAPLANTPTRGPRSLEIAPDGTMYLILREGNAVFTIDPALTRVKRLAGTGELGYSGDGGPAISATFGAPGSPLNGPKGIAYSGDGLLYVVDCENHVIRKIDLRTGIITTLIGTGQRGDGPDGDPKMCRLSRPHGIFVRGAAIYIGDSENHRIRMLEGKV